jgi:hypothetical protein
MDLLSLTSNSETAQAEHMASMAGGATTVVVLIMSVPVAGGGSTAVAAMFVQVGISNTESQV